MGVYQNDYNPKGELCDPGHDDLTTWLFLGGFFVTLSIFIASSITCGFCVKYSVAQYPMATLFLLAIINTLNFFAHRFFFIKVLLSISLTIGLVLAYALAAVIGYQVESWLAILLVLIPSNTYVFRGLLLIKKLPNDS